MSGNDIVCDQAKDGSGFNCSNDATFYICSNKNEIAFKSFVGCCRTHPDVNVEPFIGCKPEDLADATYNGDKQISPPPGCIAPNGQPMISMWKNCKDSIPANNYVGCCDTCGNAPTCQSQRGWARFVSKKNLDNFATLFGMQVVASTTAPTATKVTGQPSLTGATGVTPNTTDSTSLSPASPENPSKTPQITPGSAAGIAIGCTIAGLLLGALVSFLLLGRRKRRTSQPEHVQVAYAPGKGADLPQSIAVGEDVGLDQFLLHPRPDNEIISDLRALDALIRQHVENNYHMKPVHQSPKSLAQALIALGISGYGQRSPDDIARLAIEARTRYAALQHIITRVALQSSTLSLGSGASVSMLPSSVAAFVHSVPATERHRGNAEAMATALTKWRQLSAFLLHPNRSDRTPLPPPQESVAQQAQQLSKELNRFLQAFVVPGRELNYEQEEHLRQVLAECARFGYLLFSQPAEYRFNYDTQARRGGVVVCPGLERVSDGEGRPFSKPQVLSAPVEDV